jgi:hypothetical protein
MKRLYDRYTGWGSYTRFSVWEVYTVWLLDTVMYATLYSVTMNTLGKYKIDTLRGR